jgi:hypothetical protein
MDDLLLWGIVAIVAWLLLTPDASAPAAAPALRLGPAPIPQAAVDSGCVVSHPALTALDDATMFAAYAASFRGIYGRESVMQPGTGADDGAYWVAQSNHFGAFGDGVCRAGWNAYWEQRLAGADSADPALGDQPAIFQP